MTSPSAESDLPDPFASPANALETDLATKWALKHANVEFTRPRHCAAPHNSGDDCEMPSWPSALAQSTKKTACWKQTKPCKMMRTTCSTTASSLFGDIRRPAQRCGAKVSLNRSQMLRLPFDLPLLSCRPTHAPKPARMGSAATAKRLSTVSRDGDQLLLYSSTDKGNGNSVSNHSRFSETHTANSLKLGSALGGFQESSPTSTSPMDLKCSRNGGLGPHGLPR
mmetsp:Transcript_31549/g.88578  ORF Transcript_31549/g.88578 Transcript_31549/m.88578 type:complete len:224 (-) Transcript_31549:257-928(-)